VWFALFITYAVGTKLVGVRVASASEAATLIAVSSILRT
jgi:hypothetical protein